MSNKNNIVQLSDNDSDEDLALLDNATSDTAVAAQENVAAAKESVALNCSYCYKHSTAILVKGKSLSGLRRKYRCSNCSRGTIGEARSKQYRFKKKNSI